MMLYLYLALNFILIMTHHSLDVGKIDTQSSVGVPLYSSLSTPPRVVDSKAIRAQVDLSMLEMTCINLISFKAVYVVRIRKYTNRHRIRKYTNRHS